MGFIASRKNHPAVNGRSITIRILLPFIKNSEGSNFLFFENIGTFTVISLEKSNNI